MEIRAWRDNKYVTEKASLQLLSISKKTENNHSDLQIVDYYCTNPLILRFSKDWQFSYTDTQ